MAWGYWSATSVGDRGRSPRREKDSKQQQQQQTGGLQGQQNHHQQQLSTCSSGAELLQSSSGPGASSAVQQMQGEISAGGGGGPGVQGEDPPCTLMIQGGSFYSYSAAAAAAAAAAAGRRASAVEGAALQAAVLPRDSQRCFGPGPSAGVFLPSPCSDSADEEHPHGLYVHQEPVGGQIRRNNNPAGPTHRGDEESDQDADQDDVELIYASNALAAGCLLHGPCGNPAIQDGLPPPPVSSGPSLGADFSASAITTLGPGTAQFGRFNNITWGRSWPAGRDSTLGSNGTRSRLTKYQRTPVKRPSILGMESIF